MKTRLDYVGIRVKDLEKSIEFYTKLLGLKVKNRTKIEQTKGEVVSLQSSDGFIIELNYYRKDSPFNTRYVVGEGLDHIAFEVDDLDKAIREAELAGYPKICEVKTEKVHWAYVRDPNGIWIEFEMVLT
jgi:lactoylglutathione lyase